MVESSYMGTFERVDSTCTRMGRFGSSNIFSGRAVYSWIRVRKNRTGDDDVLFRNVSGKYTVYTLFHLVRTYFTVRRMWDLKVFVGDVNDCVRRKRDRTTMDGSKNDTGNDGQLRVRVFLRPGRVLSSIQHDIQSGVPVS